MIVVFHVAAVLFLIVLQTAVFPWIPGTGHIYDLLTVYVIYLGLLRPMREGLIVSVAAGLVMDYLSGGPIGQYLTVYFWVFAGVCWLRRFLHFRNHVLMTLVVVGAVAVENIFFFGIQFLSATHGVALSAALGQLSGQLFWAVCTGALFLAIFQWTEHRWMRLAAKRRFEARGPEN